MQPVKRTWVYITGGALIATGAVGCHNGMHYGTPEERGEWIVQKVTKELELNTVQQEKLVVLKDEFLDVRGSMKANREQHHDDIKVMLNEPTFNRDLANAMVSQHVETVNARAPVIIDAMGNFWESLDDDQRTELRAFIEDKMDWHQHRRHWY